MSVVINGLELTDTAEWWGWELTSTGARGNVDPASRQDFFDELRVASTATGALVINGGKRLTGRWIYDSDTGAVVYGADGGGGSWSYGGDSPYMSVSICCYGRSSLASVTCDNADSVGTPITLPDTGLEAGRTNWYDGVGANKRTTAQAHSGSYSWLAGAHTWYAFDNVAFTAGKRYIVRFWYYSEDTNATADMHFAVGHTANPGLIGPNVHWGSGVAFSDDYALSPNFSADGHYHQWQQYCIAWEPAASYTDDCRIDFHVGGGYIDDLEVFEGPAGP